MNVEVGQNNNRHGAGVAGGEKRVADAGRARVAHTPRHHHHKKKSALLAVIRWKPKRKRSAASGRSLPNAVTMKMFIGAPVSEAKRAMTAPRGPHTNTRTHSSHTHTHREREIIVLLFIPCDRKDFKSMLKWSLSTHRCTSRKDRESCPPCVITRVHGHTWFPNINRVA